MTVDREAKGLQAHPAAPPPSFFNMAHYCLRAGHPPPDKPALVAVNAPRDAPAIWSYDALEKAVLRGAHLFRGHHGLPPGGRIIVRLRNSVEYAIGFFGAIAGGLVPIPASPDLTSRELEFLVEDSEAGAILFDDTLPHGHLPADLAIVPKGKFAEALEGGPYGAYAGTRAEDAAFLIYTSGTTAAPKGVLHAHRSAWGRRPMYRGWYGILPSDRVLHAGSFNWTYTLGTGLADPWANGATALVHTGEKTPDVWPELMAQYGVTIFAAVPGVYRQMLKHGNVTRDGLSLLRHGLCAGETLAQSIADGWREGTGTVLYEALGQSELSTYISSGPDAPPKKGTVGKPQPGRRVVILPEKGGEQPLPPGEPGLIAAHRSDPGLMLGYWKRPEEEATMFRGNWFIGGDAGVMDDDGYVAHLGRRNELMNAGGFRVSPLEVEQQLLAHPAVAEAAVAEVPVADGVSIIAAFIVPAGGARLERDAIAAFAAERLARYKQPREYVFVDALPRTGNGKLKRSELRHLFANRAELF